MVDRVKFKDSSLITLEGKQKERPSNKIDRATTDA